MSAHERPEAVDLAHQSDFPLGALVVQPSIRTVSGNGAAEVLEPRVMQVPVALARRRGAVVSRDELVNDCWAGRVVGDDAISRCIIRLRRLGEAHGGFVVETIPRVGYRLTEKVVGPPLAPTAAMEAASPAAPQPARSTRPWIVAAVAALVVVAVAAGLAWHRSTQAVDAKQEQLLDQVVALVAKDQFTQAFTAARPLLSDERIRRQPRFIEAWRQIVLPMRPIVAEEGATVYFKAYDDVGGDWIKLGTTPLPTFVDAPRGQLRVKVEKPGFRTGYFAVANWGLSVENESVDQFVINRKIAPVPLPLLAENALPEDMVVVPHTNIPVTLPGWTKDIGGGYQLDIAAFAIDREEVTNRQFKEFIDAGGYENPAFWEGLTFEDGGRALSWEEARKRFVDSTGRPGPSGWQLSAFPKDQADFPVGGISWYEAAAYAKFRGRQLPTLHHWVRAAFAPYDDHYNVASAVALASQFSADGPRRAIDQVGIGPWGTLEMAGNVREWVWNSAGEKGLALGGAWTDYVSDNRFAYTTGRMQRSPEYGVRLMKTLTHEPIADELLQPIQLAFDDAIVKRAPASDEVFEAMRLQFNQVRGTPTVVKMEVFEESALWVAEEVTLKFASPAESMLYIVRPKTRAGKWQPIIFAPAQYCCVAKLPNRNALGALRDAEFVVNSGRALVLPIWMGSYERFIPPDPDPKAISDRQRRAALAWRDDLGIALDYLATRDDIDAQRAGFLSISRGSAYNVIALAIDERVKAAVLVSGGIELGQRVHPMLDLVNYAPRIKSPVLMINGRFDHIYLYKESQQRLLDLLGAPGDQKQRILYDAGHYDYPRNSIARDATDWFDRYLGSAR